MKIFITTILVLITHVSIGQNNITKEQSPEATNNGVVKQQQDINQLTNTSNIGQNKFTIDMPPEYVNANNDKKWEKTKKKIQRNKRRFLSNRSKYFTSKTIDTIYLDIPLSSRKSHISKL